MAVVNTVAENVSYPYTTPPTVDDQRFTGGKECVIKGHAAVAAGDDDTSTYRLARVHSSWVPTELKKRNTAITAGTVYDVGLFYSNGGAAIDANCFANDVDLSTADTAGTDILHQNATDNPLTNSRKQFWQIAGLTADPNAWLDIVFTGATVGTAAGTIHLTAKFTKD